MSTQAQQLGLNFEAAATRKPLTNEERWLVLIWGLIFSPPDVWEKLEAVGQIGSMRFLRTGTHRTDVKAPQRGLKTIMTPKVLFVEQNEFTGSDWALMAGQGHRVMWGINRSPTGKKWLYRCVDGLPEIL